MITKDMLIGDVVKNYPPTIEIMLSYGLRCVGCGAAYHETIEQGAATHGMDGATITEMLEKMNNVSSDLKTVDDLTVSQKALDKIKDALEQEGKQSWMLRIGIQEGGCAGFSYGFGFAETNEEDDTVFDFGDVKIVINDKTKPMLLGATIDYVDSIQGSGFRISNPNASRSCGCGNSFS